MTFATKIVGSQLGNARVHSGQPLSAVVLVCPIISRQGIVILIGSHYFHTVKRLLHIHPHTPILAPPPLKVEVTYTHTKEHLINGAEWGQFQKQNDVYAFHILLRLHKPFFYFDQDHSLCVLPDLGPYSEPP